MRRLLLAMGGLFVERHRHARASPDTREWQRAPLGVLWCFVPGMALAALEPAAMTGFARGRRSPRRIAFWLGIVALLRVAAQSRVQPFATGRRALVLAVGAAAPSSAPHSSCSGPGERPWRWLDNRVFRFYGEISYSFYLFHFIVLTELIDPVQPHERGVGLRARRRARASRSRRSPGISATATSSCPR